MKRSFITQLTSYPIIGVWLLVTGITSYIYQNNQNVFFISTTLLAVLTIVAGLIISKYFENIRRLISIYRHTLLGIAAASTLALVYTTFDNQLHHKFNPVWVWSPLIILLYVSTLFFFTTKHAPAGARLEKASKYILTIVILTIVFSTGLKLYIAPNAATENDEGYTHSVNLGWERWHDISTSYSGVEYTRTPIYNTLLAITLDITNNPIWGLRLFNIIFIALASPLMWLALRKLFSLPVAITSFVLIQTNWFLVSLFLAGRSYTFAIIFAFFALYFLIRGIQKIQSQKTPIKDVAIATMLLTATFFEGHIVFTYHLLPLFVVLVLAILYFYKTRVIKIISGSIAFVLASSLTIYITIINPSFGLFIIESIKFNPSIKFPFDFGSIFSYYSLFGIGLIFVSLSYALSQARRSLKSELPIIVLMVYSIFIYLVHATLLTDSTRFFAYISDLVIPLTIIVSYFLVFLFSSNFFPVRLLGAMITLTIVGSSVHNYIDMYNGHTSWRLDARPFAQLWETIPPGSIVLTDQMLLAPIFSNSHKTYSVFRWVNDDEITSEDLEQDMVANNTTNARIFSNSERARFKETVSSVSQSHVVEPNQLYSLYSGDPMVMNTDHLKKIINSSSDKKVYIIYTHAALDSRSRNRNPELHDFIMERQTIIDEYSIIQKKHNDEFYSTPRKLLTLSTLGLE